MTRNKEKILLNNSDNDWISVIQKNPDCDGIYYTYDEFAELCGYEEEED